MKYSWLRKAEASVSNFVLRIQGQNFRPKIKTSVIVFCKILGQIFETNLFDTNKASAIEKLQKN